MDLLIAIGRGDRIIRLVPRSAKRQRLSREVIHEVGLRVALIRQVRLDQLAMVDAPSPAARVVGNVRPGIIALRHIEIIANPGLHEQHRTLVVILVIGVIDPALDRCSADFCGVIYCKWCRGYP